MAEFNGTSGADTLTGGVDADVLNPGAGADVVNAGAGDDVINYTSGQDTIDGGAGTDTVKTTVAISAANATEFVSFAPNDVTLTFGGSNNDLNNVEKVEFSNGTLDLTSGNDQWFGTNKAVAAPGANIDVDDEIVKVDLGLAGAAIVDVDATFTKITHINGTKVDFSTADAKVTLASGSTLTVQTGGGALDGQVDYVRKGTFTHKDDVETFTVTLTDGTNSITRDVTLTTTGTTIDGNANTIVGDSAADAINLFAGNDTVDGAAGNDSLTGGFGDDSLKGGAGDDVIDGGDGTDLAHFAGSVGAGASKTSVTSITANQGAAVSEGTDTLSGIEGITARNLGGSFANLTDFTPAGAVVLNADAIALGTAGSLTLGTDAVFGGALGISIAGGESASASVGAQVLQLTGSTGKVAALTSLTNYKIIAVTVDGVAMDNSVANGDSFTIAGAGTLKVNEIDLTKGDNITYSAATSDVTDAAKEKAVVLTVSNDNGATEQHVIVDLSLGGNNDTSTITSDDGGSLSGGIGKDNFTGGAGNDTLDGGDGDDTLSGGAGNDQLSGGDEKDNLSGGDGDDQLLGGDGDDTLNGGDGNDFGNGGDGADIINGGKGDDAFFAGADDNGNDTIKGEDGNDTLGGGDGGDNIDGGAGENLIFGGDDNDTIVVASGDDSLEGNGAAWGGEGKDTITGGSKDDVIGGGDGDDSIVSGDGNDTIYGGKTGDESITAGKGDDLVFASTDRDTVTGGDGNDTIYGGDGKDSIDGDAGTDQLWGGADNDTINGGAGNDTIDSGAGNDSLTGGTGADTFTFATGSGADTISDFKTTEADVLDLSGFGLGADTNILDLVTEQTVSSNDGIIINLGNNDSIFLADVTLSQIRDANIIWDASA